MPGILENTLRKTGSESEWIRLLKVLCVNFHFIYFEMNNYTYLKYNTYNLNIFVCYISIPISTYIYLGMYSIDKQSHVKYRFYA